MFLLDLGRKVLKWVLGVNVYNLHRSFSAGVQQDFIFSCSSVHMRSVSETVICDR